MLGAMRAQIVIFGRMPHMDTTMIGRSQSQYIAWCMYMSHTYFILISNNLKYYNTSVKQFKFQMYSQKLQCMLKLFLVCKGYSFTWWKFSTKIIFRSRIEQRLNGITHDVITLTMRIIRYLLNVKSSSRTRLSDRWAGL